MNKTYRSVWNEATGTWSAVQENAVASGKRKGLTRVLIAVGGAGVGVAGFLAPGEAWADFCADHGAKAYNYTATGVASNCSAWQNGVVGGAVVGQGYFDAMGVGYTQIVSDGVANKIYFQPGTTPPGVKPSTAPFYATLSNGTTGVLFSGLNNGLSASDAVNVSQLKPLVTALGGGTAFNTGTGAVTGPTYVIAGTPYHDVGSALDALNKSASNPDVVLYDSSAHDSVTLRGAGSTKPVALRNIAAGAVNASSTDAVNGAQLYGLASSAAQALGGSTSVKTDGSIGAPSYVLSGKTYNNVGDALGALSGPDPLAVHYDDSSMSSVRLGGSGHSPVVLSNVAAGTAPTDAVNVAQMQQAVITGNPYIGGIGSGVAASATSPGAVALGLGSVANTPYTISVGNATTGLVRRITNVATAVDDSDAVNLGQVKSLLSPEQDSGNSSVSETRSVLKATANLGSGVQASGNSAAPSSASEMRPLVAAATQASTTTDASAVHYDSDAHDQVTLSSASGGNVKLTGLQDAALAAGSTDAATGGQLYVTNQQVASLSAAMQNISTSGSTGVAINSTNGIAAATGVQSIAVGAGAAASGANSTAIGDSANAKANNSVALGANSVADRDNSVSVGAAGSERQIVNVAAGTQGTDAVNLNQLNTAMTQQSNAFNQQIGNLQNSINTVSKNAYSGVAAAMAMPNLTPSGPGRTVVAAGGGYYMGGSAAAVGVTYRSANMHWLVNGGVSLTSTGNMAARTQVGYEF